MFCLPLWMFPFLSPSNQYKYFRKNSPIRLDPIYLIYKSAFEAPSRIRTTFRSDGTEKRLQKSRQKIQENNRHSPSSSENRDDLARSRKITGQSENDWKPNDSETIKLRSLTNEETERTIPPPPPDVSNGRHESPLLPETGGSSAPGSRELLPLRAERQLNARSTCDPKHGCSFQNLRLEEEGGHFGLRTFRPTCPAFIWFFNEVHNSTAGNCRLWMSACRTSFSVRNSVSGYIYPEISPSAGGRFTATQTDARGPSGSEAPVETLVERFDIEPFPDFFFQPNQQTS